MRRRKCEVRRAMGNVSAKYLRRTCKFALCTLCVLSSTLPAHAQTQGVEFLPRFDFVLGLERLADDNPRFVWDGRFGGELDLVDFGRGRATFTAEYKVLLGEEFRIFNPNQGNYTLAAAVSGRVGGAEVAGVFHHVSRHLSNRPKRQPVDWNMAGARVRGVFTRGRTAVDSRVDVRGVVQRTYVDYRWEIDAATRVAMRTAPRAAAILAGGVRVLGVDGARGRGTQYGARGEGGVRLEGTAAAVELFVAAERRIDPHQLQFSTGSSITGGFRVVSR